MNEPSATPDRSAAQRALNNSAATEQDRTKARIGAPMPLGTLADREGVNFAFFSRSATRVRLELFDHPEDSKAARVIDLDPATHRTGDVWHMYGFPGFARDSYTPIALTGHTSPKMDIASTSTSFSLIRTLTAITQLPAWDFAAAREIMTRPSLMWTHLDRRSTMPVPRRSACSRRSIFDG